MSLNISLETSLETVLQVGLGRALRSRLNQNFMLYFAPTIFSDWFVLTLLNVIRARANVILIVLF